MDLRLLGPVEVCLGDAPIELGPRKQRAVLAMLALRAGRTVSADRLAEGLWGDEPPASAPKMVQLYVSHLRRVLEGNGATIVTRGRGYELQLSSGEVDIARFERLLDESHPREALALWRGEALADLADEPFAAPEIRRLDELRLRASERAIDADLAAGRHNEVIGELEGLVAQEPLREHLHAQRMLALYRAGRQSEALEAYRDARSALVDEVGVEPGDELRRLQDAILAHDPALELPAPPATAAAMASPPDRRSRKLLVAAAVCVVAGLMAYGVIRVVEPEGLPGIHENWVGVIEADSGRIRAEYGVGKSPDAVAVGAGSVWVANQLDGTVTRIDREGKDPAVTITVGRAPSSLAFGSGSLWVADGDDRTVAQVDPGANKISHTYEVGNAPRALAATAGAVWVASGADGRIREIDLRRGRVRRSVLVGANPSAIAAGAGALWVASEESGTVTRIDPRSGQVVGTPITVGHGPSALAFGEGAVWVVNRTDGTVSRIDPDTNSVSWSVGVGHDPAAVAVGEGAVWVAGGEDGTVARVDPDGPRKAQRFKTGSSPAAIAVAGGSVWTAAAAPQSAHRGGTLRVLIPMLEPGKIVTLDWISDAGWDSTTVQLTSLVYDGLVTYRRVGGAGGATLVGDLATSAPAPSDNGRTYRFSLRGGLRYSDGRPVRPADFRASIERFLRVTQRTGFPPFYEGIVGARRCLKGRARCSLARGIETDERAGTITIHLTRADGTFLHKLANPFAYVVPADTPVRLTGDHPPPGTGPYRVERWARHRGGSFVRNPYFRPWSPQSRPAGFANRIDVHVRGPGQLDAGVAEVRRGAADLSLVGASFARYLGPRRLAGLAAALPGQVRSEPDPGAEWMFLNVKRPPFDSRRVRQAVNFATDRARLVELAGGSEVARATCQIVPTAFPGYEPYCPYTAAAKPRGGWVAPDLERAHSLVQKSGRVGERVEVRVPTFQRDVGRYFVGLLDDLGFRASLDVRDISPYFSSVMTTRSRAQMGFVGWGPDLLNPSTFIETGFGCAPPAAVVTENPSQLCDRRLTTQIHSALAAPPADAGHLWALADRRVTDLAPAVPMLNGRLVFFVSKRVGNIQQHPAWNTLLDQMWVR